LIVFLIGLDRSPSAALQILAHRLEKELGQHVAVHELAPEDGERWRRQLDRLSGIVDEAGSRRVGLCCTIWNTRAAFELCSRLLSLWPDMSLSLWGAEASTVARALGRPTVEVLSGAGLPLGLRPPGDGPQPFCRERLGEIARASARLRAPVVVERLAGTPLPLHQLRGNGLPLTGDGALGPEQALAWIGPLLRAGLAVRFQEPAVTGLRSDLERVLRGLGPGRLLVEIPAEQLDEGLVQLLLENRVQQLDLDLTELALERLDPAALRRGLQALADAGLRVRGILVCGHPAIDLAGFGRAVDRCFVSGIDDLVLRRLVVPPDSPLRSERDLVVAGTAPYEALSHGRLSPAALRRCVRFIATLDLLRDSLRGTGVFRALCDSSLSAFEVVEGFGESLAAGRIAAEQGEADPPRPLERLFAEHLRTHHGVDLETGEGRLRLMRPPGLTLRWLGNGSRLVADDSTGRVAHMGRGALALIDRCDQAQTIHELCEQLVVEAAAPHRDRLRRELRVTVDKLATMGFLVPDLGGVEVSREPPFTGLDEFDYHYRMLMDRSRVEGYRRAIERAVRPGDHVVEVGTGTGILAVLAAQLGARVTAIERYAVLEIAREVARRSGVGERVEFIRGRSDLVALDEPADVLVTELVGNRILNEGLLEVTLDARRRLLRPGATLVPRRLTVLAQLGHTGRFARLERELCALGRTYTVDLAPLSAWLRSSMEAGTLIWELGSDEEALQPLSGETTAVTVDLGVFEQAELSGTFSLTAERAGEVNAVVLSFVLELHDGIELTTRGPRHDLHWNRPVVMLSEPVRVAAGEVLSFQLGYELGADIKVVRL